MFSTEHKEKKYHPAMPQGFYRPFLSLPLCNCLVTTKKGWYFMGENHMPMGFTFSMSANEKAMNHFARMSEEERAEVIQQARNVSSKKEMERLIQSLSERDSFT